MGELWGQLRACVVSSGSVPAVAPLAALRPDCRMLRIGRMPTKRRERTAASAVKPYVQDGCHQPTLKGATARNERSEQRCERLV